MSNDVEHPFICLLASVYLFWRNVFPSLLSLLKLDYFPFHYWVVRVIYIFWMLVSYQIDDFTYIPHLVCCLFTSGWYPLKHRSFKRLWSPIYRSSLLPLTLLAYELFHFFNLGAGFMGGFSLWFVDFSAHVHKASTVVFFFFKGVIISAASSPGSLRGLNGWMRTQYLAPLSANTQQLLTVVKNQSLPLMEWMILAPGYFTSSDLTFLICKMGSAMCIPSCSVISDSATPWTAARQAPLSVEFSAKNIPWWSP